ncbi:HypC/HybG/HupF family hydrogenase formation chaperone [bacterium]|nr:HypC/HybG/HupF family hydrogenase formation chaperone [bacterium]
MCLAVPMRIVKIDGNSAVAEAGEISQTIDIQLVPSIQLNDYVIVHAGFAIQKMDESYAREALELFEEMGRIS